MNNYAEYAEIIANIVIKLLIGFTIWIFLNI